MDYYSVGGGFVESGQDIKFKKSQSKTEDKNPYKFHFDSAQQLSDLCKKHNLNIS